MTYPRLPIHARRSTSKRSRTGMTLIELVASLSLFVIILGTLLTILNSATTLWSSSRNQQREQTVAKNVLDILSDDLQNAVTDSGAPSNTLSTAYPAFVLDSRTNQPSSGVQIILQFARHAKTQSRINVSASTAIPLSLDAVFYTFVDNALYRHAIPLSYASFTDAKPLGELLQEKRAKVDNKALHAAILAYLKDPANQSQPSADWSYSLLAERIDILSLPATLPEAYARQPKSHQSAPEQTSGTTVSEPPVYDYLEADVMPDRIDVALRLHSEEDWSTLQRLVNSATEEAAKQRQNLGFRFSKRITFPSSGGSRLP